MKTQRRQFTTGEVARFCGFSPSAVLHWIRTGKLRAFSSPGRQHRIDPRELERFLREHEMEVPAELAERTRSRILIVDDEPAVSRMLAQMLQRSGLACQTETAAGGLGACALVPQFRPDLIVLDLLMPELDGAELCRAVRSCAEFKGTKFLVVTGAPDHPRLKDALDAGADGWMAKPVEYAGFIARVRGILGLLPVPMLRTMDTSPLPQETAG